MAYTINLDEYSDIGIHWIALHVNNNDVTYFDSFGAEHIPKEIKKFINNKNIKTNISRIQTYDSVMCEHFCIGFIDFMFNGKTLTEYTNLFSPKNLMVQFCLVLEMNENNSIKAIGNSNLAEQTKLPVSEIIGIENYFYQEIDQRKSCSKKLNKYVTAFDYIDKILIVLSATSSGVSIISFTSIIGAPVGIASASFTLIFSLTTGIVKNY